MDFNKKDVERFGQMFQDGKFDFSCQVLYIKYSMSKMEFIFK